MPGPGRPPGIGGFRQGRGVVERASRQARGVVERASRAGPGAWGRPAGGKGAGGRDREGRGVSFWKPFNRVVYRAYYRARYLPDLLRSARWTRGFLEGRGAPRERDQVLVLAWGRIGDTLLSLSLPGALERIFPGRRITWVGRPETRFLLEGRVGRFLPFSPEAWRSSSAFREEFLGALWRKWEILLGDLHLFFGGLFYWRSLIEILPAEAKILYSGYAPPPDLAPWRPFPAGVTLVPSLPRDFSRRGDPAELHVSRDLGHYVAALSRAVGRDGGEGFLPEEPPPLVEGGGGGWEELSPAAWGLPEGPFILLQLGSNSSRRRYPLESWKEVIRAFPSERFLALGSKEEGGMVRSLGLPNVHDLCGKTRLEDCARLMRSASAFAGMDSGLAHLAARMGAPTVCLAQSSNLGYFVPYPPGGKWGRLEVVSHPGFLECSGCMMVCSRESLWRNARRGLPCLRSIPPGQVVGALEGALEGR